jgi:hypothetical protein
MKKRNPAFFLIAAMLTVGFNPSILAINLERDINDTGEVDSGTLFIPYAFYNDNTEFAVATVLASTAKLQPQSSSLINAFVSSNDTYSAFMAVQDYQIPFFKRLFVNAQLMISDWGELESYQDGNPAFPDGRAGSATSDKDNFVLASGPDNYARMKFRFILPIGEGAKSPIHEFRTVAGLLAEGYEAGGNQWNPFSSGRTTLDIEPFYREQDVEDEHGREFRNLTSGVKLQFEYDNLDWYKNPSYGSRTRLSFTRDWGLNDDSNTWTAIQFEFSKFVPLQKSEKTRQRVLAFNFWTSDVPTHDSYHHEKGEQVFHRAPLFEGSTLGGIDRQRGYPTSRFHDRSAVNYSMEYRHIPTNSMLENIPLINKLYIPWWQYVVFVEAGSVADNWAFDDLHKHIKVTAGAGLRLSVAGLVIRVDLAGSDEGGEVQMFFGHIF